MILILTSGQVKRLEGFGGYDDVTLGSFMDISYGSADAATLFRGKDLKEFDLIYFRFVGKSFEVASLVANYAIVNRIKIVDKIYEKDRGLASSLGKSLEIIKLIKAGLPVPKTFFNDFTKLEYPFVVKSTTGQRAKEVWLINNESDWEILRAKLENHKFYFAQEFIAGAKRIRTLVIGEKVIGGILRHTKWNKDVERKTLNPVPGDIVELSLKAAKAADLDICGVDILVDEKGNKYLIEANAAPTWKLIAKNCGVNVEDEIVKYLRGKI